MREVLKCIHRIHSDDDLWRHRDADRAEQRKDTGTVRFTDGDVTIVSELPKRVEWDQDRLAAIGVDAIGTDDPAALVARLAARLSP